ncbi:MAG TPA: hypothetical protein VFH07_05325 [Chitinophagaceae bacterium]|nr:hypothetical protein [Chitinophagaceae bacterium]
MKLNRWIYLFMFQKRNLGIILVVVVALLLIVFVIWLFEKRLENIEIRMR